MVNDNFDRDYVYEGDPRRCPRHPHVKTSTPDGMFDMCCNECEAEMEDAEEQAAWDARPEFDRRRMNAEAAAVRRFLFGMVYNLPYGQDDIPF